MIRRSKQGGDGEPLGGFTVVELIITVAVIAILATLGVVGYHGMQRRAGAVATQKTLLDAQTAVELERTRPGQFPEALPAGFRSGEDIDVAYRRTTSYRYSGLTPVQHGVLFHSICEEVIADPQFSTITARDGSTTQSVVMRCSDSISNSSLLITGWDSKTWSTPLAKETLETYIDSVPYDNWWTDRQEVVRGFYRELISRYEERGGTWPITSFWDPWANQWSGVPKDPLPDSSSLPRRQRYCIQAAHVTYDVSFIVTSDDKTPREGVC